MRTPILACGVMIATSCGRAARTGGESAQQYLEAKAGYVRALKSDTSRVHALAAMHDLETRLRTMIGPLDLAGRTSAFNPMWLTREGTEGGELDAILFGELGADTLVWVTTPELVSAWVRAEGDSTGDPLVALAGPERLHWAIPFNAAFYRYIDIGRKAPLPEGVRVAHVVAYSQDNIPITPSELLIIAQYGDLAFLVLAPAVKLATPADCSGLTSTGQGGWRYIAQANERDYLSCFDRVVPEQPQFQHLVAQVASLAKLLRQARAR